jgi:hypothetical protein
MAEVEAVESCIVAHDVALLRKPGMAQVVDQLQQQLNPGLGLLRQNLGDSLCISCSLTIAAWPFGWRDCILCGFLAGTHCLLTVSWPAMLVSTALTLTLALRQPAQACTCTVTG